MTKPTRLSDLARRAGVSISTASRALNDSPAVNMRTKQRIWRLARELDYPFRRHMPAGPIGAKATVSIVAPRPAGRPARLSDPFLFEFLSGVGDAARERDCDVHISYAAPSDYEGLLHALTAHRADGVMFVGQSSLHNDFNRLAEEEADFVVWGAALPDQRYCCVGGDNLEGGRRAAAHLARLGRERIAFLGDIEAPEAMQRYRGYRQALEAAGLVENPELFAPVMFSVESAETGVAALLAGGARFDAVVAASDVIALGAIRALKRAGLNVPRDVSVVGYDDIAYARLSDPALTTINQDLLKAGRLMLAKLLDTDRNAAPTSERLPTELVVRDSCGA